MPSHKKKTPIWLFVVIAIAVLVVIAAIIGVGVFFFVLKGRAKHNDYELMVVDQ